MDPRESVIHHRLHQIKKILVVASGKGGVGKSLVASSLALSMKDQGKTVGLLDLDMYGPSAHVILGVNPDAFPKEDNGILPFGVQGMKFMSTVYFTKDKPAAFRGEDITNIMIELLAITRWDDLDVLIIDMPPGLGDEMLDVLRFIPEKEFLIVTTSSKVAYAAVKKLLLLLKELHEPIVGVIENMTKESNAFIRKQVQQENIPYLGALAFDDTLEKSIGNPKKHRQTSFYQTLTVLQIH